MIYEHESVPSFLSAELRRRIQTNPQYSLRAFAKSLKLSPGALSEVLKGQRGLSLKAIPHVAKAIGLNKSEAKQLLHMAQISKGSKTQIEIEKTELLQKEARILSEEVFTLVADWYHFAILNLIDCEGFSWNSNWISSRLGISRTQAKLAMDLLLKLKIVIKTKNSIRGNVSHIISTSEIPSGAIRSYHRQILEKAIQSLDTQNLEERDISGIGFALDASRLEAMKKEIAEFQEKILAKYSHGKKRDVYFLEMALFKLTRGDG
ncbi:MAG: TIGR02147 family protein [Bdellovibrionales bacterium]|nr:TIGR02147 family protein [Bdellovibrionales bacterium]